MGKHRKLAVVWWLALFLSLVAVPVAGHGVVVPAYFPPNWDKEEDDPWLELARAASLARVEVIAVMNPQSGPGERPDLGYMYATGRFKRAGGVLFGYVRSLYGTRALEEMEREIDAYFHWYGVSGIFLDEAPRTLSSSSTLHTLQGVQARVKRWDPRARVLQNHGTLFADELLETAEMHCVYENGVDLLPFRQRWRAPEALKKHPADRFVAMVYGTVDLKTAVAVTEHAWKQNIGYVFVTDDRPMNPWDRLPLYWRPWVSQLARR